MRLMSKSLVLPAFEKHRKDLPNVIQNLATYLSRNDKGQPFGDIELAEGLRTHYADRILRGQLSSITTDLNTDIRTAKEEQIGDQPNKRFFVPDRRSTPTNSDSREPVDKKAFAREAFEFFNSEATRFKTSTNDTDKAPKLLDVVSASFAKIARQIEPSPTEAAKLMGISIHTYNKYLKLEFDEPSEGKGD